MARALATAGHGVARGAIVLGADTAVVVDGEILGKPRDDEDAAAMLRRLSGRRHEVLTGVSLRIRRHGESRRGRDDGASVLRALSDADIAWYVASGEGRDKAGGYAIQGLASRFIQRIEGSYSNVVGLAVASCGLLRSSLMSDRSIAIGLSALHPGDSRAILSMSSSRKSL